MTAKFVNAALTVRFGFLLFFTLAQLQAHAAEEAVFDNQAHMQLGCKATDARPPRDGERYLFLVLRVSGAPAGARIESLEKYLTNADTYSVKAEWTGVDGLVQIQTDNQPLIIKEVPRLVDDPRRPSVITVCLLVEVKSRARGELLLKDAPEGWILKVADRNDLAIRYSHGKDPAKIPPVQGKVAIGYGSGGSSMDLNVSRALSDLLGRPDDPDATATWTAVFSAKIPLGRPHDVENASSAESDASGQIPDALSLDLNRFGYDASRGSLSRFGFRGRSSGSLEGIELTTYYSPFAVPFNGPRGFLGTELEVGYREGDHEFQTTTVKASERGNAVARVGAVVEWAPEFLGVNRDLSQGFRFFVRARGWLDYYKNDWNEKTVRFAKFLDSEFFYNFTGDTRVFVRGEYGELPPDLTRLTQRVFLGVGQAF